MTPPKSPRNRVKRPYQHSGHHVVNKALPYLLERVTDPSVPDETLSPVELAARAWRQEVIVDLGGLESVPAARRALLDAATGSKMILDCLDRYLFELAESGGLVNRRNRKAFAVVQDRMRVADSLTRQLQALGMERQAKTLDLAQALRHAPEPDAETDRA